MSAGQVVAKLAYPMPAGGMQRLVKALEALYGKGLVVDFADPEAGEWMIVQTGDSA